MFRPTVICLSFIALVFLQSSYSSATTLHPKTLFLRYHSIPNNDPGLKKALYNSRDLINEKLNLKGVSIIKDVGKAEKQDGLLGVYYRLTGLVLFTKQKTYKCNVKIFTSKAMMKPRLDQLDCN